MNKDWTINFDMVCEEHDGVFGHNIEIDKSEFTRLIKLGARVQFNDYYSAVVYFPKSKKYREQIILKLIDMMPSYKRLSKDKKKIFLEWHY